MLLLHFITVSKMGSSGRSVHTIEKFYLQIQYMQCLNATLYYADISTIYDIKMLNICHVDVSYIYNFFSFSCH